MNNKGNFEKFKKGLKDVIDSFERAKEWADLSNCLQKVKKQFDQNQGTDIPMKKDLAKRLAQCLNPDLAVIHQLTLEVYGMIFQRQIELMKNNIKSSDGAMKQDLEWGSDLGLFYSGLFNFYQFAAFEVKDPFLQIIETYILQLDKELLLSLPGFMICMLPALEDQNAQILKRVEVILAKTEEAVGTSEFYGEIWKAMLRTTRTRLSAIKYLEKKIPKDLEQARQLAKLGQIYASKYNVRVSEQKVTLARDDATRMSEEMRRLEMMSLEDYFYFYYPLKEKLCINSLLSGLSDSSVYVNRGVLDFLISHAPITGNINTLSENVRLVEGALLTLHKKDFAFLKKFFTWTLSHLEDEESRPSEDDPAIRTLVPALQCMLQKFMDKSAQHQVGNLNHNQPILILQTLLNDNVNIIEPILVSISVDLIKFIKLYHSENSNKSAVRFIDNVGNFFEMVNNQINSIWMALGQLLSSQIRAISVEYAQDAYSLEAIDLIDFCLRELKLGFERQNENFIEQLRPIISRLLSGVEKLSNYMNNLENAIPALNLIEFILQKLGDQPVTQEDTEHLKLSVDNFNNFYVKICKVMTNYEDVDYFDMFKIRFDTFKKSSQILNQIQVYSYTSDLNQMPEWLKVVIECSKTKRAKIVLVSIETFLNILSKQCTGPEDPLKNYSIIQNKKLQNLIVRFEPGLKVDEKKSIYQILQDTNNPYCTDIIKTLWSLLDEEEDHLKIVSLLKIFDGLLPSLFSEVVIEELNSKDREVKVRAIKKFAIFWKLTAQDYPNYKPFYDKNTDLRRQVALHNMLHILEDNDPTLRLSCKSWLSESKQFYGRILDPLIEEFLQNSKVFMTSTEQIFFYKDYEAHIVIENFGKLRNIILNTQEEMIIYMMNCKSTEYIGKAFEDMFYWIKPRKQVLKCQDKYLQIIVYITLQFIIVQAPEQGNEKPFSYQESQTVNASACEFMELILKRLEQHKEASNEIAHIIIDPILQSLSQVIDNQNHAMQVHLLNLLKVIFFQCNFDAPESKADCERIFKDATFIQSIVKGMKNEISFVRYHFIQFTTTIVPLMNSLIKPQDFTIHIKKFIDCFCDLLKHVDVNLFATQQQLLAAVAATVASSGVYSNTGDNSEKAIRLTNFNRMKTIVGSQQLQSSNLSQGQVKSSEQQVINQESDISQIISGLEQILCYCLGIVREYTNKSNNQQFMQQIGMNDDQDNHESSYKQVELSLGDKLRGFFSSGPFKKGEFIVINDNQGIKDAIYLEFQNIIVSCLYCWNDLPVYIPKDYYFSRSGIFPYDMDDEKLVAATIDKSESKAKESLVQYIKTKTNNIQKYVIEFLRPLAETSPHNFLEGILLVWMNKKNLVGMNLNKSLEKMMQILISVRLKPHVVIDSINKFIEKRQLMTKKPSSNKIVKLQKLDSQRESMICQFLYTFLLYNISQQFKKDQDNSLSKIYIAVYKFIKFYQQTKHPSTICWLLEILHILSNKYTASDAFKEENKLRKDYLDLLTNLLTSTASILSDTFKIEFDKSYGFKIVFSPTVYELLRRFSQVLEQNHINLNSSLATRNEFKKKYANPNHPYDSDEDPEEELEESKGDNQINRNFGFGNNNRMTIGQGASNLVNVDHLFDPDYQNHNYYYDEKDNISQLMIDLSQYINKSDSECPSFLLLHYFKFFTIITLKSILYHTVQSICLHSNHDKITNCLSIIVNVVLQILSSKQDKDKDKQAIVIREAITDFFATLMDKANQLLVKPYKREISELFYSDNFFQMSRRTLRKWCKIINHFISDQKDQVFEDLVYKWNTQAGLLTSKDFEIRQKCIALKRVSFLVFSGDQDQYDDKLDLLLKKMTEGFKTNKKYKELRIQLFLLTRILLLRLHANTLADALRKLWPHLLNELVSIFEDTQSDVALTFEAIKMIELMSSLNIEDFQMNQWIFLVDGYGMAFEDLRASPDDYRQKFQDTNQVSKKQGDYEVIERGNEGGIFQPFIVKFMQNRKTSFYNQSETEHVSVEDLLQGKKNQIEMRKTTINISPENYTEDALETYAIQLQYRLNELNMERTEIDRQNFEALIEKDFIQLDK